MSQSKHGLLFACFAIAMVVLFHATGAAQAGAPLAKSQAGWYRVMLGDFEVTALSDGTVASVETALTGTTPAKIDAALDKAYLKPYETSVNGFLINTGTKLVLIDAGTGALFGPTLGKLVANLEASGYQPEQVDEIYLTHMHLDHVGDLVSADGKLVFRNAIVRAGKADADFWLSKANLDKAPEGMTKGFLKGAQLSVGPYVAAGKFRPIEGGAELVPGIKAIPAPGHTPGNTMYEVTSKGQKLVAWGDMVHVAAVQLPDPSVTVQYDFDPASAATARKKVLADAAKQGYLVAAAHVAFPGLGRLRAEGTGYRWYPVNYSNAAPSSR